MHDVVATLGQRIDVPGVANLRDLGGYPTRDGGRMRSGLLYRSAELGELEPGDPAFARLGIRSVYDMRTAAERAAEPDQLPDGVELIVVDVLRDHGRAETLFENAYREIVGLDSALDAYHLFFSDLAQNRTPALFHCTTGKDRTGWAAAALLMLCDVADELVMRDFLLSGGGVHEAYLRAALDEMRDRHGTIEGYFDHGLGLDADVQSALRIAFVERD